MAPKRIQNGAKRHPKSMQNRFKNRCKNRCRKGIGKWSQNESKLMQKCCQNWHKICPFREMVILRKPCFYYSKSKVFKVQRVQKSMRNRSENHAKTRLEKVMQKWSKMMPKWSQNQTKHYQKGGQKSMRKSMQKSMQNGTLKMRVGGSIVTPLSSTQSLYLVTCFSDSYINHQRNPQNGPSAPLRGCAAGFIRYASCRRPQTNNLIASRITSCQEDRNERSECL